MNARAIRTWPGRLGIGFAVAAALVFSTQAFAQTDASPEGWDCDAKSCTENKATRFLEIIGTFMAGSDLSMADNADLIAALEQQSQREFEFAVNEAALISVTLTPDESYRPDGWDGAEGAALLPDPLLWVSDDGESYERLGADFVVQSGDLLLVAVRQVYVDGEGDTISYLPARWTLSLGQRRVVAGADAIVTGAPPLVPTLVSADTDPIPEEAADTTPVPPVAGAAQLTDGAAPCTGADCGASAPVDNELAVELQRELARVGCYSAAIDGLWGPASRRALAAFYAAQKTGTTDDRPSPRALVAVSRAEGPVCSAQ